MKIKWSRLWARVRKISLPDWRVLSLLVLGAFLQGIGFVYLDVGTLALFLQNHGIFHVGIDFICLSALLPFVGSFMVKLDRRYGYGGAPLTALLTLILVGILFSINKYPSSILMQVLFIYRYIFIVLMTSVFWTIAHRFIVLRFNSFKFLGVLSAELLGLTLGGMILAHPNSHALAYLNGAIGWFTGLFLVLKILVWLLPVSSETFVRKSGGVQDSSENKMVVCILWLAFLYTGARFLSNFFLYHTLVQQKADMGQVLGYLWMGQGIIGLILIALCCRFTYTYLQLSGLCGVLLGYVAMSVGILWEHPLLVYMGSIILGIFGHLCWPYFLSMLPQLLSLGHGRRLRWRRQVVVEPLAVLFAGASIIIIPIFKLSILQLVMTFFLGCFVVLAFSFYSRFLLHMCQMRRWYHGPLMLLSNQVKFYVQQGAISANVDDAIYFLRLMQQSDYPKYTKYLIHSLNHKEPVVRLFALDKLDTIGVNVSLARLLQQKMPKETNVDVRCRMLAMLIRYHGEQNGRTLFHKYGSYLDDKHLRSGAVLGFLQVGGDCALLAMDGLQQMAQSSNKEQNLKALDIIDHIPQTGLVRLILPLLKSEDVDIKRAALLTAGRIGHVQALSFVLSALDYPDYQEAAMESLKRYGKQAFPPIEKMLMNPCVPLERRKKLVLFLQTLDSNEGKQILLRNINMLEQKLRKDILKAILDSKIIWVARRRRKILKQNILKDIDHWHWLQDNIQKCRQAPDARLADAFAFLLRSFEDDCQDARLMILYQLKLLYPETLIEQAIEVLLKDSAHYETALSLLRDLLPNRLCQKLEPVLMNHYHDTHQSLGISQAVYFLTNLMAYSDFSLNRWEQACVLLGLKQTGNKDLLPIIKKALHTPWSIVWEIALDDLETWIENQNEREAILKSMMIENPNLSLNLYLKNRSKK